MTIEEEKRLFRKSALKKRAEITNREEKSAQIAKNLFDTKAYKNASMIFAYMHIAARQIQCLSLSMHLLNKNVLLFQG